VHKDVPNVKSSLFLTKSVIPGTYETPTPGRLIPPILTVCD